MRKMTARIPPLPGDLGRAGGKRAWFDEDRCLRHQSNPKIDMSTDFTLAGADT